MERYKICRLALRADQASRLFEFGFKIRGSRNVTLDIRRHYNTSDLFDIEFPKTAVVVGEPAPDLGGEPGVVRVLPKEGEGYVREFKWRPAIDEVPARMVGFVRLDEYVRKIEKKPKKKGARDEDDAGIEALQS